MNRSSGVNNPNWKGGRRVASSGYVAVRVRTGNDRPYRYEHVIVAERALGRTLPIGTVVHHRDENRTNNANGNLVILQSRDDHNELHRKMRVRAAGGNPWTDRLCGTCHQTKPHAEFYQQVDPRRGPQLRYSTRCAECSRARRKARAA